MTRFRYTPRGVGDSPTVPFIDAEEAWFWFIRSQRARREGARRGQASGIMARPCDPDDLYRAVMDLFRRRNIGREHLDILGRYGWRERPPDPRRQEEERPARLWGEALDRLNTVLQKKGIVESQGHG
ncbi:MAG TPA: hypothetical protein ENI72_01010 [Rhodospirillales bacterium]|nr:hypothetical protein [Rhodospirillales bacterium]